MARFDGGYLTTSTKEPIELTGKHSTVYLRVHDVSGEWNSGLLSRASPEGPWEATPRNIFDGLFYSKMHEFQDGRAPAAGWVGWPGWGGNIVVRNWCRTITATWA